MLEGELLAGEFHARRLRTFVPRNGTKLAEEQKEREKENDKPEEQSDEEDNPTVEDEDIENGGVETENEERHENMFGGTE